MANKTTDMSKIRKVIKFYSNGKSKLFISNYLSLQKHRKDGISISGSEVYIIKIFAKFFFVIFTKVPANRNTQTFQE